jgi:ADP-dependent NAD(P)H-hydrate dehydratase / NAD(P)H-hydrate epimerase
MSSERVLDTPRSGTTSARALFSVAMTRAHEALVKQSIPPYALMERAGLVLARFALAVAPHAKRIWVVCGPGNNGGDGLVAARYLKLWGKDPIVSYVPPRSDPPADAGMALQQARQADVTFTNQTPHDYALCIDALFGIGPEPRFDPRCTALVQNINAKQAAVIAADIASGLNADTGCSAAMQVMADYTLSFLTLKPGVFTANGRDASGEIWFNALQTAEPTHPYARLNPPAQTVLRAYNTHKGTFGDVAVVGGAPGMLGAALLAARAALHSGAGRVYLAPLDPAAPSIDIWQPELMFRRIPELSLESITVVAGCGGGSTVEEHLHLIVRQSGQLVLDADALNAIAKDHSLQMQVKRRPVNTTVLTPHPLEAARLLGIQITQVQQNRIAAARSLANRFNCTTVLKGSGTVIAAPAKIPQLNPTGNANLATAGTGDVLAGIIGARLASGHDAFSAACGGVYLHGQLGDAWYPDTTLTAQDLVQKLRRT